MQLEFDLHVKEVSYCSLVLC